MLEYIKNLFKPKTYDEIMFEKTKDVVDDVFSETIDWNIQTSMYELMTNLYSVMDDKYLEEISNSIKDRNSLLDDILSVQREALIDILTAKWLLTKKDLMYLNDDITILPDNGCNYKK